jgi:RNA polymerase sigma-70 factor, ECF subfamily
VFEKLSSTAKSKHEKFNEQLSFLKMCFGHLNESDQRIILLRYHENLKSKEIAARLGKSVRNIYLNISRIQELLLHCIKKHSLEVENGHA